MALHRHHCGMRRASSLADRFDPRNNGLNLLRLCLALEVLAWHAYALRGSHSLPNPASIFLGAVGVDGFFVLSGFLIGRSWIRRPHLGRFLLARGRRILPGLWFCLAVVAFVVAPLSGRSTGGAGVKYWLANANVYGVQWDVAGGPSGVPIPHVWNGSLWSLPFEASCYFAVAVVGLLGLLTRRFAVATLAICWALAVALEHLGVSNVNALLPLTVRIGLMFSLGVVMYLFADRIPIRTSVALGSVVVVAIGVISTDYRTVAAPALAYLLLYVGVRIGSRRRLVVKHDLSYGTYLFGFPVQQALLLHGLGSFGWAGFFGLSILAVLPLAAASWFLVERPALRFRSRSRRINLATAKPTRRSIAGLSGASPVGHDTQGGGQATVDEQPSPPIRV